MGGHYFIFQIIYVFFLSPAAAAAKSLQSCPTLCDPIDSSPTGSAVPGRPRELIKGVDKTWPSNERCVGLIPGWGAKILRAS